MVEWKDKDIITADKLNEMQQECILFKIEPGMTVEQIQSAVNAGKVLYYVDETNAGCYYITQVYYTDETVWKFVGPDTSKFISFSNGTLVISDHSE